MKNLLLFIFLTGSFIASSQINYRFRNYSISNGLSQSSVTTIIQDNSNALWIGTQDGLNRFDGKHFEVYDSDNNEGIENSYIKCSGKTSNGSLWFGTSNGLLEYNTEKDEFKTYFYQNINGFQIDNLSVDNHDNVWLASPSNGLIRFNSETKKFTNYNKALPSRKIQTVYSYREGEIIIVTEDFGAFYFNFEKNHLKKINIPFSNGKIGAITKIIKASEDLVFFSTTEGVFQLNIVSGKIIPRFQKLYKEFGNLNVTDILSLGLNKWIVTSNEGLFTIMPDGSIYQSTEDIFQKQSILNKKLTLIYKDFSGSYWIGSERGLSSFNPKYQDFYGVGPSANLNYGLPTETVWCFAEDKKAENLYVGTDVGVSILDRKSKKFTHCQLKKETTPIPVRAIYVSNENNLLLGTDDGLYTLKISGPNNFTNKKISVATGIQEITHSRVYSIFHWKEEKYFLGTKGGVILYDFKSKKSTLFEHLDKKKSNPIGICRLVFKSKKGTICFATSLGGLYQLSQKNNEIQIVPYTYNNELKKLSKDYINSVYQPNENEFYFGTLGAGMLYWNEKTKSGKVYTKSDGLSNNVIYSVLPDERNNIWLSTNRGLICFNLNSKKVTNYDEINGLVSNEFNLGAYLKSSKNQFFFGSIYGYNFFNPSHLRKKINQVDVKFTRIKFEENWLKPNEKKSPINKPLFETSTLNLSYKQRSFTLQFIPNDIINSDLLNYKYRLVGGEEGDVFIGNTNEFRLTSLEPGEYTLEIYCRLGEGKWTKSPTTLNLNIKPPFWWTWWFWGLSAGFLFLMVRLFIRQKVELERRKVVRMEMKVAERTREIRAKNSQIEAQKKVIENEKNKVLEQQKLLEIEKEKTEKLIRKIIPESTVEELKNKGTTSARAYKRVSVLFTDFVGFTKRAEQMKPTDLVNKLDVYFTKFDEIIVKHNLEKIKTIGDAYMCAGGVPVRNATNPIDTCLAALEIQDYMLALKQECIDAGMEEEAWNLRLGINTGEVTAGVIGRERLAYDIWGATVNRAQRMEMLGEPGKVTITGETYNLVKPFFECTFRGKVQSKSKEFVEMYTVDRIKPQLSSDSKGIYPNERFYQIINLYLYSSINYNKAEKHITKLLEKRLSEKLHYHSVEHMKDVVRAVENIALMENVTDEGLFLLKSAASYHDAGFIEQYDKNEPIGARLAEEILPKYGYTEQHIQQIKELIYVTQIPHNPKNKLEEIMCDADLDYLGRDDFHEIADKLRRELREHGKIDSDRKWDEIQVIFLTNHKYFTQSSINLRREKKLKHLEQIKQRLIENNYVD